MLKTECAEGYIPTEATTQELRSVGCVAHDVLHLLEIFRSGSSRRYNYRRCVPISAQLRHHARSDLLGDPVIQSCSRHHKLNLEKYDSDD